MAQQILTVHSLSNGFVLELPGNVELACSNESALMGNIRKYLQARQQVTPTQGLTREVRDALPTPTPTPTPALPVPVGAPPTQTTQAGTVPLRDLPADQIKHVYAIADFAYTGKFDHPAKNIQDNLSKYAPSADPREFEIWYTNEYVPDRRAEENI